MATRDLYTISLHDALPICGEVVVSVTSRRLDDKLYELEFAVRDTGIGIPANRMDRLFESFRSEEHTSELQSQSNLVCRLLLEKQKKPFMCAGVKSEYGEPV